MLSHYLAKVKRSSNLGMSGRKSKRICNMLRFLNTRPILKHLAYLLTYLLLLSISDGKLPQIRTTDFWQVR